ncbi:homeobox-DDT domain protein RLT3-like isoform X1 [Primulina huaijiensis]|uniref:homeobox-DDT domain protein RLT3-like isoform X1 n=1 Tax=Primulina huaijiensis TaxID=1492673 RepID=UPI003CC70780
MINKRLISSRKDSADCGNGLNCDGNDYKKRKGRKHDRQRVFMTENDYRTRLQEILYSPEHILMKIFRKDGPTLGGQFDSVPSNAFLRDCRKPHHEENGRSTHRKRKVSMHAMLDYQVCCENCSLGNRHGAGKGPMTAKGAPTKKHGMGKGFMSESNVPGKKHGKGKSLITVWRVRNPDATDFSDGVDFNESTIQKKKKRLQRQQAIVRKLANKEQTSRKTSMRSRKMECQKVQKQKQPRKEKCELAFEDMKCLENTENFAVLLDDEELELQELQAGPNPLSCSAHFPTNGSHGCSLCKDLLVRFPPSSVTMKPPLFMQPWASSQELMSKLFKVFQFLCTYACTISMYSFTLEEFAHAFHDKDSLLLGQVHLALLKLLLKDVDKELGRGFLSHASKNCKFLQLLQSLEHHTSVLELWQSSLNLLTWTEILRQVLVAAGFGPKLSMEPKEASNNKKVDLMEKYPLSPGTLKGELFNILLKKGNSGMKVSELAQSSSIVELSLADTLNDLENLIMLALSGDMTLFEKISSSGYRLRINADAKECEDCSSGSEDFGSVDDTSEVSIVQDNENDSEHGSRNSSPFELGQNVYKNQSEMLMMYNEIDESYPGEVWLLGLMEGEYSDLNIDERLSALSALIDLLSGGSTVRMEDPLTSIAECSQNINIYGSGAKIKRSNTKQCSLPQSGGCGQTLGNLGTGTSGQPTDSLVTMSKISDEEKYENMKMIAEEFEVDGYIHPMQSVFLGADRRYNRYWLFLGPCDESDPGHRRIYFESSEDGHWEVIDMREALCTLMLTLNRRGAREAQLLASLEKREAFLFLAMSSMHNDVENGKIASFDQSEINTSRESSSSPVSDVDNNLNLNEISNNLPSSTGTVEDGVQGGQTEISGHSLAFDVYLWKSFYYKLKTVTNTKKAYLDSLRRCDQCHDLYWREEKHCRICHTTFELDFDLEERYAIHYAVCQVNSDASKCRRPRVLSSRLQSLKAAIYAIESVVPEDAFFGSWKRSAHNLWVNRLRRASNLAEFLQVLADFVTAIKEDWFYQNCNTSGSYCIQDYIFSDFSTVPHTYSAVALWIVKLDLLVASHMESCKYQNKSKSCR